MTNLPLAKISQPDKLQPMRDGMQQFLIAMTQTEDAFGRRVFAPQECVNMSAAMLEIFKEAEKRVSEAKGD